MRAVVKLFGPGVCLLVAASCVVWANGAWAQAADAGLSAPPPTAAGDAGTEPSDAAPGTPDQDRGPAAEPAPEDGPSGTAAPSAPARSATPQPAERGQRSELELSSYGAVAVAPAPGARIELEKVPRNVQSFRASDLPLGSSLGLHDALRARLGSVIINDVQSNPLQPDFQYRGFTASPLLGTPQGLAVYQDGVRINEPFGDVLAWDMLPTFALQEVQLLPGTNPIYGLNALGGSLVLRMKDGFHAPGYRVEGMAGSFARYRTSAEYGQAFGDLAVYAGASVFGEQGFRDNSPSSAQNLYADVRKRTDVHEYGLHLTLGNSTLNGNGPAPIDLVRRKRSAVFTWPDTTRNELIMLGFDANQRISERLALQGTAYLRHGQRHTLNGDEAEFALCDLAGQQVLCSEQGQTLQTEAGRHIVTDRAFDSVYNTSLTKTDGYGGALQVSVREPVFAQKNVLVAGLSYDGSQVSFLQRAELGWLTPDRTLQGTGTLISDPAFHTDLMARNHAAGAYVSDTLSLGDSFALNLSARFNFARIELNDRLGSALDGKHNFARVNPALGFTYQPIRALTLFASYGESNRAPSAAELSCADPDQPCRVPNAFISDPPLKQVVSRSAEAGLRGHLGPKQRPWLEGSMAGFFSRNFNDILFVGGSRVGTGYFQNAGETQRIGLEAALNGTLPWLSWYASYTLLRATFESELELPAGAHPGAAGGGDDDEGGTLEVEKGSRIPGLPSHSVKAGFTISPTDRLSFGVSMLGQSSQPYRGDEPNTLQSLPGFVVLSARAGYRVFDGVELALHAQNLLNTRYGTFGVIADPSQVLPKLSDPRFMSPGAPFGIWASLVARGP